MTSPAGRQLTPWLLALAGYTALTLIVTWPLALRLSTVVPHDAGDPIFNGMWTLLHVPCLTMPARVDAGAMPVGLQLVGPRFGDARLLGVAETIASAI